MVNRRGLGKGKGKGYKNIIGKDPAVHSQSAKGIKQPDKVNKYMAKAKAVGSKYTPRQIIKKEYGDSRNMMTPNIVSYGKLAPNVAYELSKGKGIYGETIYGISIVKIKPDGTTERLSQHSGSMQSKFEADKYIKDLKGLPDKDGDGIPDRFDCDPNDPKEQDLKENLQKLVDKAKKASTKGLEAGKKFSQKELTKLGEVLREGGEAGVELTKNQASKIGEWFKEKTGKAIEFGKEVTGEAIEFGKKKVEEQKEKSAKEKEKLLSDIDHPYTHKLEKQEKRVNELQNQVEKAEGDRKARLEEELYKEQSDLRQIREKIANLDVEDLTDQQLKQLAVRYKPQDFFGFGGGNKYEEELLRRIRKRKELEQEIKEAKKEKPKEKEEEGGGLRDLLALD